jgi:hypothetical protein
MIFYEFGKVGGQWNLVAQLPGFFGFPLFFQFNGL